MPERVYSQSEAWIERHESDKKYGPSKAVGSRTCLSGRIRSFAFAVSPRLHALMVHVFAIKTSPISRARSVNRTRRTTNSPGKSRRAQVIQRIC